MSAAPRSAACFIADQLEVSPDEIQSYARREQTRRQHFTEVREHLGFSMLRSRDMEELEAWLVERALYAAILAQACNFGLTTRADIADLTYRQLAWTTDWYLREETLKAAFSALVDFQHQLPLAEAWGGGTLSSSEGQRFPVRGSAENATALPKYFGLGRGLTFYTWTSDQYSQYGSKVISSTVRDATYVLDEILDNQTDLPILEHTTDTAGYTGIVFALFHLLGLQFAPRIRDLGAQRWYRLDAPPRKEGVAVLLKGLVRSKTLLDNWDELLRVAGSLKLGWVSASLLISKLQAGARENVLSRALRDPGRLVKTQFILRGIENPDYRRRIHRQLNQGEALHALRRFLFLRSRREGPAPSSRSADESGPLPKLGHECPRLLEHRLHERRHRTAAGRGRGSAATSISAICRLPSTGTSIPTVSTDSRSRVERQVSDP